MRLLVLAQSVPLITKCVLVMALAAVKDLQAQSSSAALHVVNASQLLWEQIYLIQQVHLQGQQGYVQTHLVRQAVQQPQMEHLHLGRVPTCQYRLCQLQVACLLGF